MNTRAENLRAIALAPIWVIRFALATVVLVVMMLPMIFVIGLVVLPPSVLWLLSPVVGVVSPAAGQHLAGVMDKAMDVLDRVMDVMLAPVAWLMGA